MQQEGGEDRVYHLPKFGPRDGVDPAEYGVEPRANQRGSRHRTQREAEPLDRELSDDDSQRGLQPADMRPNTLGTLDPAAVAYAQHELQHLPQDERAKIRNEAEWVANRAAVLPDTEWGRIVVARMARRMSGAPEGGLEAAAWNELIAEPRLLPAGVSIEEWIAARQGVNFAKIPGSNYTAHPDHERIAGDKHVAAVRAAAHEERVAYNARRRAQEQHDADIRAVATPLAGSIFRQLQLPEVDFSKLQGNGVLRTRAVASGIFNRAIARRQQLGYRDPFGNLDPETRRNRESHFVDALTFAILENGLNATARQSDTRRAFNSEAIMQGVHELLDHLDVSA